MIHKPLKIALVTQFLPEDGKKVGGVTVAAQRLAVGLAKLGHEVTVYSLNPPSDPTLFHWRPITTHPLLSKLCRTMIVDLFAVPIVLNFTDFSSYDVLHFGGNDTFYFGKRPRFRTMYGSSFREFQHTPRLLRKPVLLMCFAFEWTSVWRMDSVFTIGTDTAQIYNLGKESIVPLPVDITMFHPGEKTAHPQVFYNGYWKGRKRGQFVYESFINEVLPYCPEARLVFLGDHCPDHPQVDLVRGATDQQLAKFYRESWVFAYPSTYEGFGLPYVEAMASGTTVLATPNSGANDILKNGSLGVITEDATFGAKLRELIQNPDLRKSYEEMGLRRAQDFSQEEVAREHVRRFEDVIGRMAEA